MGAFGLFPEAKGRGLNFPLHYIMNCFLKENIAYYMKLILLNYKSKKLQCLPVHLLNINLHLISFPEEANETGTL